MQSKGKLGSVVAGVIAIFLVFSLLAALLGKSRDQN